DHAGAGGDVGVGQRGAFEGSGHGAGSGAAASPGLRNMPAWERKAPEASWIFRPSVLLPESCPAGTRVCTFGAWAAHVNHHGARSLQSAVSAGAGGEPGGLMQRGMGYLSDSGRMAPSAAARIDPGRSLPHLHDSGVKHTSKARPGKIVACPESAPADAHLQRQD